MMALRGLRGDLISARPSTAPGSASEKRRDGRGEGLGDGRGGGRGYLGRSSLGKCLARALCRTRFPPALFLAPGGGGGRLPHGATGTALALRRACAPPRPIGGRRARGPGQWRRPSVPRAVAKGRGGRGPVATAGPRWTERGEPAVPPPTGERGWGGGGGVPRAQQAWAGAASLGSSARYWAERPQRGPGGRSRRAAATRAGAAPVTPASRWRATAVPLFYVRVCFMCFILKLSCASSEYL